MQSFRWTVQHMCRTCHRRCLLLQNIPATSFYCTKQTPQEDSDTFGTLDPPSVNAALQPQGQVRSFKARSGNGIQSKKWRQVEREGRQLSSDREWTDTFGSLSEERDKDADIDYASYRGDDEDQDDKEDVPFQRLSAVDRKHSQQWYGRQIEKLDKQGKIYEAVAVLEKQMLVEDRVMPNEYVFTVLIGALGRVGYTRKAFSLFNKMKKFGLKPEDPTYTALFNACSNSPWKSDGLKRANKLSQLMVEKKYEPNSITLRSMIKTYAMLGDFETAFSIADSMDQRGIKMTVEALNMLLMAAIADKHVGLRYAIMIWKRFCKRGVTPDVYSYNLLLRATRECLIGDSDILGGLLNEGAPHDPHPLTLSAGARKAAKESSGQEDLLKLNPRMGLCGANGLQPDTDNAISQVHQKQWFEVSELQLKLPELPDILNPRADLSDVVGLGSLERPEERLALLGGVPGFLHHMIRDHAKPNVKTFTMLLDLIPQLVEEENRLIETMKEHSAVPDAGFFNMLIRRRCIRGDFESAKMVLGNFSEFDVVPDMATYGCLAMGCRKRRDGLDLVKSLNEQEVIPSIQFWGILAKQSGLNFHYKLDIIKHMKDLKVKPNEIFLRHVENAIAKAKKYIVSKEQGKEVPPYVLSEHFTDGFRQFMLFYKAWLENTDHEEERHPWSGFTSPSDEPQS